MTDLIKKYFEFPSGRKEWCVSGEYGSLSFWVQEYSPEWQNQYGEKYYGGIENHYNDKSKPEYLSENSKHMDCNCNGGLCYHDGTSLWASEYWIPYILPLGQDSIWSMLTYHYNGRLKSGEE
jgi:hypothetical protein